jgi:predicted CXXCH cytochrome family protein
MNKLFLRSLIIAGLLVLPAVAFAAGGHDALTCTGCHSLHQAKTENFILAVQPNSKDINPKTNKPYEGTTAICLGCHQTPEKGGHGMTAISAHISHPYGLSSVNPKIARVPNEYLSNGRFECSSCHDPHPSNTNRKYLRGDIAGGGASMEHFCAACHPSKADPKAAAANAQESKPAAAKKSK